LAWSGHESPTTALLSQLPPSLDLAVHLGPDLVNGFTREPFEWNQYQWRLLGALLGELRQQVERSGAELSVMLLPTAISPLEPRFLIGSGLVHRMDTPEGPFTLDLEVPRERLGQLCAAAGVEFVDPCAEFLQLASRPQTFPRIFPDPNNRHWSAEGHGLLALILEPTVDRWLQSPPSRLTRRSGGAVSPPSSESASATAPPHPRPAGRGSDGPRD
jgi:hypothetical protein